jgi:hypothetical protein
MPIKPLGYTYEDFTQDGFTKLACLYAEITILYQISPERYKYYYLIMYDNVFSKLSKNVIDAFNIALNYNKDLITDTIIYKEYNMSEDLTHYVLHVMNVIAEKTRDGTY